MKHFAQNPFGDDLSGNKDDALEVEDVDEVFGHLSELRPPSGFVDRVMQAISRLPLPQMLQPSAEFPGDDDLIVHHEHKKPS